MNTNKQSSRLILPLKTLLSNGYTHGPHYIGLQNELWMFCNYCTKYEYHELMAKNNYNYHYVCTNCKCAIEYVG